MLSDNGKAIFIAIAFIIAGVLIAIYVKEITGVLMAVVGFVAFVATIVEEVKECKIPYGKRRR